MSAHNPAGTAQPGDRFTDPDGGTWVRTNGGVVGCGWTAVGAAGQRQGARTQEEAEKANLAPLVAQTQHGDREAVEWIQVLEAWIVHHGLKVPSWSEADADPVFGLRDDEVPAPAPLDPGNPDDLRRFIADYRTILAAWIKAEHRAGHGHGGSGGEDFLLVSRLVKEADRLDRERAEQAQDEADRKLAEEIAESLHDWWPMAEQPQRDTHIADVLAGIRAERARSAGGAS